MSVKFFADSSFLIGLFNEKDNFHDDANEILSKMLDYHLLSKPSEFHISNYIVAEVFQTLQKEIGFKKTHEIYDELKQYRFYNVNQKDVDSAILTKLKPFCNKTTGNPKFGLIDAISLEIMDKLNIHYIIANDSDFDNLPFCSRIGAASQLIEKIPRIYFQD